MLFSTKNGNSTENVLSREVLALVRLLIFVLMPPTPKIGMFAFWHGNFNLSTNFLVIKIRYLKESYNDTIDLLAPLTSTKAVDSKI